MRIFDFYLWGQFVRVWANLFWVLLILSIERISRLIMYVAAFFMPVGLLDYAREKAIGVLPRLLQGFRDPDVRPEILYDTPQLCEARGYPCEEHYVTTPDGFILGLHRIPHGRIQSPVSESFRKKPTRFNQNNANASANNTGHKDELAPRPAVFMMHGFLQSSEAFVTVEGALAFALADAGFDVWLGNNRGNKYSNKHTHLKPHSEQYWDFSIDEVARYDIPTVIQHILHQTKVQKVSYIGFSQGTAVAFAAFAMNHDLAQKINLFVALAPATHLKRFANSLVDAITRTSPDIIYLLFSKRQMLSSALFWQNLLSVQMSIKAIELSCKFLFNWDMKNIDPKEKSLHYSHIYSVSSVKTVVHWFQLINSGRFQMHDDNRGSSQTNRHIVCPHYAIDQITCPIALFHGGRDTLPDTKKMISLLPADVLVYEEPTFEHMDFLYSPISRERVFPKIVELCQAANHKSVSFLLKKGATTSSDSQLMNSNTLLGQDINNNNNISNNILNNSTKKMHFSSLGSVYSPTAFRSVDPFESDFKEGEY